VHRHRIFVAQHRISFVVRIAADYPIAIGAALLASYGILHARW